jgi:murein DD-endopeptidase MepM/ murein hydrolase activator NlpD
VGRVLALLAAGVAALLAPDLSSAYGWPIKPFDRQHAIRGAFDDPRQGIGVGGLFESSFHFGVDISAPDGTPVYAVAAGTVFNYPDAVTVHQPGGHEFAYWHVVSAASEHSRVSAGELIGYVRFPWGHVHFAEREHNTYLNPLRPGGLEPFTDNTAPVVDDIDVAQQNGQLIATASAYDTPPIAPPPPWQDARWTPALLQWRLIRNGNEVLPWQTAADFSVWHKPLEYDTIYAPGTVQNRPLTPGKYVFWLTHGLDTHTFPDGTYELEVAASDTRGNTGTGSSYVTITNTQSARRPTDSRGN